MQSNSNSISLNPTLDHLNYGQSLKNYDIINRKKGQSDYFTILKSPFGIAFRVPKNNFENLKASFSVC